MWKYGGFLALVWRPRLLWSGLPSLESNTIWSNGQRFSAITGNIQQVARRFATSGGPYRPPRLLAAKISGSLPLGVWSSCLQRCSWLQPPRTSGLIFCLKCCKSVSSVYYERLCHKMERFFTLLRESLGVPSGVLMRGWTGRATQIIFPWPWNDLSAA